MTLPTGSRLGPYEILSPLGAGGMGEVYKARDTRLGREVAIKVLPEGLSLDVGRLKRFEKEARAASALNHPNIVTIYDVGSEGSVSYIAMELVQGRTLREGLLAGPIAMKRLLQLATQVAEGLAAAHEAGIVHRDLKPENLMVTRDGHVKILDFGLAKLMPTIGSAESSLPTLTYTEPGGLLGTVSYMSPEQAAAQPVDFRSDQFSFGSVLYEMAAGAKAFQRDTAVDTLSAILHQEPEPLSKVASAAPVPLRWVVERCLAKNPAERYGSTRDLARDLAQLRGGLSEASGSSLAPSVTPPRISRRWLLAAGPALLAGVGMGWIAHRVRRATPRFQPVSFRRGSVGNARFTPDGQTVVYSAAWEGKEPALFTTRLGNPESAPLPLPNAGLLSVSGSGKLAIRLVPGDTLAEVALSGGAPRELLESVSCADYAPDGSGLAVARNGHLEFPIGKVLCECDPWEMRFSPRGDEIALLEFDAGAVSLNLIDLKGRKRLLSGPWDVTLGLAWSPQTGELWFSSRDPSGRSGGDFPLRAVSRSGLHRIVTRVPGLLQVRDIARDGQVLISHGQWETAMMCLPPGGTKEVDLGWLDFAQSTDLSEDGTMVLFREYGGGTGPEMGVYVRKTDGSPAVRLGTGIPLALSPDKKHVIVKGGSWDRLTLMPTGAGESKILSAAGMTYEVAQWFPDGQRILFQGNRPGEKPGLFVQDVAGGDSRSMGLKDVEMGPISPDGKRIAARGPGGLAVYPIDGGQPLPLPGLAPGETILRWDERGEGLYVARERGSLGLQIDHVELASGRRRLWKEITPPDPVGFAGFDGVSLTPDGRSYVYTARTDRTHLYVVAGLE